MCIIMSILLQLLFHFKYVPWVTVSHSKVIHVKRFQFGQFGDNLSFHNPCAPSAHTTILYPQDLLLRLNQLNRQLQSGKMISWLGFLHCICSSDTHRAEQVGKLWFGKKQEILVTALKTVTVCFLTVRKDN